KSVDYCFQGSIFWNMLVRRNIWRTTMVQPVDFDENVALGGVGIHCRQVKAELSRVRRIVRTSSECRGNCVRSQVQAVRLPYIQKPVAVCVHDLSAGHKCAEGQANAGCESDVKRIRRIIPLETKIECRAVPTCTKRSREWFTERPRSI